LEHDQLPLQLILVEAQDIEISIVALQFEIAVKRSP
jgi:hypothetical protein